MFYLQTAFVWRVHSRDDVTFIENKFKFCFLEKILLLEYIDTIHQFGQFSSCIWLHLQHFILFKTPTRAAYKYCISHNADTSSQLRIQHKTTLSTGVKMMPLAGNIEYIYWKANVYLAVVVRASRWVCALLQCC